MYLDLVLGNGHGADALLLPLFLGLGLSEQVGGGIEMAFEAYAAVRGHQGMKLPGDRLQKAAQVVGQGPTLGPGGTTTAHSPVPVPVACAQARK